MMASQAASNSAAEVQRLIEQVDDGLRLEVFQVVARFGAEIVSAFYDQLRILDNLKDFFEQGVVEDRLSWVMRLWLTELFFFPRDSTDVTALVQRQVEVGQRHAFVNVPLAGMQTAVAALKRTLFSHLIETGFTSTQITEAVLYANGMVDWAIGIINRVFVHDMLDDARDQQTLKFQMFTVDMALQAESLRASLFDWHRHVLHMLHGETVAVECVPTLRRTNLGLWILHKGELLLPDTAEIRQLKTLGEQIDDHVQQAAGHHRNTLIQKLRRELSVIDQYVSTAATILGSISNHLLALQGGRDSLTRLFNRRFLRTILHREVQLSISTGERFAVIILDIDHFKSINDRYGHTAGDAVLRQFSELLLATVRAGDFVFRYGGEEFLIVVACVTERTAAIVAEKLRVAISSHHFKLMDEAGHTITASLGVAVHDGHLDFNRVIDRADRVLLEAKKAGRNRWRMYDPATDPGVCEANPALPQRRGGHS
jgi:diguanylate cyclase